MQLAVTFVKTGMYQVLLFSPEMTITDEYDDLIHDKIA
jgi:hypothetical protein